MSSIKARKRLRLLSIINSALGDLSSGRPRGAWKGGLAVALFGVGLGTTAWGGTVSKLNGTSGSNVNSSTLSTNGDLDVQLGFFADYLVVAGGGGGGAGGGGGGGAGGLVERTGVELSKSSHAVTVGAGGAGGAAGTVFPATPNNPGATGGNSVFSTVTANGGGGGGPSGGAGLAGGSGGGGGSRGSASANPSGGSATQGSPGRGNSGGAGSADTNPNLYQGGGGGGANQNGFFGGIISGTGGPGGAGASSSITGANTTYAGGGGGGSGGGGGNGGGGAGGRAAAGSNGTDGRGGGGGGGGSFSSTMFKGGNGGSGIVIVRYEGAPLVPSTGEIGGTVSAGTGSAAGRTLHTFSTVGNSSFDLSNVDMNARLGAVQSGVISGTGNLSFSGPGSLTLAAANTHSGTTIANAGTLNLGNVNAVQNSTLDTSGAGTVGLTLSGQTYNVGGLQGSGALALGSNTISVGSNNVATTYTGVLSGTGGLTKVGTGSMALDGNNTYTGATNVNAGRLAINGNQSAATGAVTVASGAVLEGDGIVGGATTISSGGIHSPGNSPAIQTFANGLTYDTGSTFQWELTGNTATAGDRGIKYDGVDVTSGALTINSGVTSNLVFNASGSNVSWSDSFWGTDQSWRVFNSLGSISLASSAVFSNLTVSNDSGGFSLNSVAGRESAFFNWSQVGSDLYLNYFNSSAAAVPEPSTCVVLAMAGVAIARRKLRSRRLSEAKQAAVV